MSAREENPAVINQKIPKKAVFVVVSCCTLCLNTEE
jgi:hypothetical protein